MKRFLTFTLLMVFISHASAQVLFRSGIFLHHSTGACIWGPNGSSTSVPQEMGAYNLAHSYSGVNAVTMNEEWWSSSDNEWATQHSFFENPDPVTGIGYYLPGNRIIVIKSCFPSSAMTGAGQAADTMNPYIKSVYNYKWHWKHILNIMKLHPGNFFVIWTNAPLEPNSTNPGEGFYSNWFCTWAKDTLAAGLDPGFGTFPANVYVFDFFHKLTGTDGIMLPAYAAGPGNSHPNAAATELVAPQFVSEIFDAAIAYESVYSGITEMSSASFRLSAFPNPCKGRTHLRIESKETTPLNISLYDVSGRCVKTLIPDRPVPGVVTYELSPEGIVPGIYQVVAIQGRSVQSLRLIFR